MFTGSTGKIGTRGAVQWAVAWTADTDGFLNSYCNTIPTPDGGTHKSGLRSALTRGLKDHAERANHGKRAAAITSDDLMVGAGAMLSVFIREPEFQGQTKDRLATAEAQRIVEQAIKDPFDHWLAGNPLAANKLLDFVVERAEERLRRRAEKDIARKSAVRKLRLPGKLADCTNSAAEGSELFVVEGNSAGGSAKQARERASQAVLPLRGKILNVASAGKDKLAQNQQLADLVQALGCGAGAHYRQENLRYDRVIIMTDADVDGAHIASLLITFFYQEMRGLIDEGHLYLAVPPLYRLSHGGKTVYARDDKHKEVLLKKEFHANAKVEVGRFKGLGEMMAAQLKETTMDRKTRTLLRVVLLADEQKDTEKSVERLMGTKPEARFAFIQERAEFAERGRAGRIGGVVWCVGDPAGTFFVMAGPAISLFDAIGIKTWMSATGAGMMGLCPGTTRNIQSRYLSKERNHGDQTPRHTAIEQWIGRLISPAPCASSRCSRRRRRHASRRQCYFRAGRAHCLAHASARPDADRHSRPRPGAAFGGPIEEIRPGDVVWFPPGEKHWHGASPKTRNDPYRHS